MTRGAVTPRDDLTNTTVSHVGQIVPINSLYFIAL